VLLLQRFSYLKMFSFLKGDSIKNVKDSMVETIEESNELLGYVFTIFIYFFTCISFSSSASSNDEFVAKRADEILRVLPKCIQMAKPKSRNNHSRQTNGNGNSTRLSKVKSSQDVRKDTENVLSSRKSTPSLTGFFFLHFS